MHTIGKLLSAIQPIVRLGGKKMEKGEKGFPRLHRDRWKICQILLPISSTLLDYISLTDKKATVLQPCVCVGRHHKPSSTKYKFPAEP